MAWHMTAPIIRIPVEGQKKRRCSFGVVVIRAFKLTVYNFLPEKKCPSCLIYTQIKKKVLFVTWWNVEHDEYSMKIF